MRSGRLRHKITLQSKVETRDQIGGSIITWEDQGQVWAGIEPLSGQEYFSQQTIQAETKVRIVIRYHPTIDSTWRIAHDGLYYDIVDIINESTRNRMQTLMCLEGVKEGAT